MCEMHFQVQRLAGQTERKHISLRLFMSIMCHRDNTLDTLGKMLHIMKINFASFFFLFNVATRKFILGWPKSSFGFFSKEGSSSTYLSLTPFETIWLDCIGTTVIGVCFKKLSKLVNNCAATLMLKTEGNT